MTVLSRIRAFELTLLGTACAACSQGAVEPSQRATAAAPSVAPPTASESPAPSVTAASAAQTTEPVPPPEEEAPVEPASTEPPAGVPAPLYAELFVKDKRWAFRTEEFGRSGKGTCTVAEVLTADWGVASRIACEGFKTDSFFTGDPFTGWWAAVPEGLIRLEDRAPTRAPDIEEAMALLAPKPRSKVAKVLDTDEPPFWDEVTIRPNGTGWCMKELSQGHDAAWWSVCIEPRRGFRAGVIGWRGGVTQEKKFRAE
jgi:hypothetical protein